MKLTKQQAAALLYYAGRAARDEAVQAGASIPEPVGRCPEMSVTRRLRARGLMEYGGPSCELRLTAAGRLAADKAKGGE